MVEASIQQYAVVIRAEPLLLLDLQVGKPVDVGTVDGTGRRCVPIIGGTVSGRFDGTVLAGGADWQLLHSDGSIDIQARYVLELADGRVEVDSRGIRTAPPAGLATSAQEAPSSGSGVYFRTAIRFRTGSQRLAWLNHILAVSSGERMANRVHLAIHEIK